MPTTGPLNFAIVGCGNISTRYAQTAAAHTDTLRFMGGYDLSRAAVEALVQKHGGKVYAALDDVLADPDVEAVVNLTIHQAHYDVIKRSLNAGKHVHTEKPLTLNVKQAWELVRLAKKKKLRLSAAPITFMGEAEQTAWKFIREGRLGKVRVIYAEMNWGRLESWHPNPAPFYEVGALADVGVYPLTVLTSIFGPARRVTAAGGVLWPKRTTKEGKSFVIKKTPDWACVCVEFASGPICRLTSSFYVGPTKQHGVEFHGDKASMFLGSPHDFHAPVQVCNFGSGEWAEVPHARPAFQGVEWARGLTELHDAIRTKRPQRATGEQAAHVVEIIFGAYDSIRTGRAVSIRGTFKQPKPMDWAV
ncbi:MAG: Gfo/Idh/MocA family oxidoreductase [Planctomycetes bacterium]|nr:Gfo/Idh/MocA family oxidoreductase [Planctomycetota bacterium]